MLEPNRRKRHEELFAVQETIWRNIWILLGAGVLLVVALFIMCIRLELLLKHCHCVT